METIVILGRTQSPLAKVFAVALIRIGCLSMSYVTFTSNQNNLGCRPALLQPTAVVRLANRSAHSRPRASVCVCVYVGLEMRAL